MSVSWRRALSAGGIALMALLGVYLGTFHTAVGRSLVGVGGGCPFAHEATAEERDAQLQQAAAALRGRSHAALRPALGFAFETTRRADVEAWAERVHARCHTARAMDALECLVPNAGQVPGGHLEQGEATLFFTLDGGGRLKGIALQAEVPSSAAALASLQAVRDELASAAGAPSEERGDRAPSFLERYALAQASSEFRFDNYYAVARATNLGAGGYSVSQTYRSLID